MVLKIRDEYIDSLRGIAVLLVFFYHFEKFAEQNIYFFNGGFFGVDIFFLISGYILTKNFFYKKNININFLNFILKRLKRLMPTLSVMVLFFSIICLLFYSRENIIIFSKSLLFSQIFASNFFFSYKPGISSYHNLVNEPFLHTWSLSVEFQIYIFFIIFIYLNYKKKIQYLNIFLIVTIFLSLLSSLIIENFYKSYNFYLTTSRLWEFCLGSLIAINFRYLKGKIEYFSKYFKILSPLIILFFVKKFQSSNEIMSPVIASSIILVSISSLIILSENKSRYLDILICNKFFSNIGKISYSLYIWHFPTLVFYSMIYKNVFDYKDIIMLVVIIFTISSLNYFLIEKKFNSMNLNKKTIIKIFVFLFLPLILILKLPEFSKNDPAFKNIYLNNKYYVIEEENYHDGGNFFESSKIYEFNDPHKKKILIIGNSMGRDLYNMVSFDKNFNKKYQIAYIPTQITCLKKLLNNFINCQNKEINNYQKNYIRKSNYIFISTRWNDNDFKIINFLKEINKKIVIFSNNNEFSFGTSHTLLDLYLVNKLKIPIESDLIQLEKNLYKKLILSIFKKNSELKKFSIKNNLIFIDLNSIGCNFFEQKCKILTDNREKIYLDYGHLTISGAKYFGKSLTSKIDQILK